MNKIINKCFIFTYKYKSFIKIFGIFNYYSYLCDMKKYLYISIGIIIIILSLTVTSLSLQISKINREISTYDNNFKALNLENKSLKDEAIAYKFSIEQLEYINDSIIDNLNTARKQLKIKDEEILQMQKIKTEILTRDSIFIKDTIFRDNFVKLDTVIGDKWHTIAIKLTKDKLAIDASYRSDLSVFAKSSKEIIGTPKKCFIGRLFQRKHKIIRVEVTDANPRSIIKEKKFIIIE